MRIARFIVLASFFLSLGTALALEGGRKLIRHTEPVYPEIARRMHMTGKVEIEITIDPSGNVKEAKVLSGNSMLSSAAVSAAKTYKYEPGEESTNRLVFEFH